MDLKPGDLIDDGELLVIRVLTFKEYCDRADDHMLEYDVDDAWERWQKSGPLLEVLDKDGRIGVSWSK